MNHGIYRGIVTNVNDPEGKYRLRAQVPVLLGKQETDWAWPCVPPGWGSALLSDHGSHSLVDEGTVTHTSHALVSAVPAPGTGVWIMFEAGDIEKPVWMGVWL